MSRNICYYQGCALEGLVIVSSLELDELVIRIGGFLSNLILAFYFSISMSIFQHIILLNLSDLGLLSTT